MNGRNASLARTSKASCSSSSTRRRRTTRTNVRCKAKDYPKPNLDVTSNENYQRAKQLSGKLSKNYSGKNKEKSVIVIGGGLAGLSTGKYLTDLGYSVKVVERMKILGGKVSACQDKDGAVSYTHLRAHET